MTRHVAMGMALVTLVAFGRPMAFAAEHGGSMSAKPAAAKPATPALAPQLMSAEGLISKVDLQAKAVTIKDAMGKEWMFALGEKTSVWQGGQLAALSALKPGTLAKVRYLPGGKQVARSIEIKPAAQ